MAKPPAAPRRPLPTRAKPPTARTGATPALDPADPVTAEGLPELSPEVRKLRARFLAAVEQLGPEEGLAALRARLAGEAREMYRLGNLAAQTWLVRQRFQAVMAGTLPETVAGLIETLPEVMTGTPRATPDPKAAPGAAPKPVEMNKTTTPPGAQDDTSSPEVRPNSDARQWQRLRILEETEVNGVRFFAGTNVDVSPEDGARLIAAGSAEAVIDESDREASGGDTGAKPVRKSPSKKAKAKAAAKPAQ